MEMAGCEVACVESGAEDTIDYEEIVTADHAIEEGARRGDLDENSLESLRIVCKGGITPELTNATACKCYHNASGGHADVLTHLG